MSFSDERGILQVVGEVVRRTFDFRGRSRRLDGLIWYLIVILVAAAEDYVMAAQTEDSAILQVGQVALAIVLLLPLAGWSVRRFHDINQSGWWALVLLIPFGAFWSERSEGAIAFLWMLAWIMVLVWPPSQGDNRFGPNPRRGIKRPT